MNFKKMMKRGQEGFTLVELIVVIAILGILGGIAVPAYSGYVDKANMAADQSLANEVANALLLHYYSNPAQNGVASVVLTTNGANAGNSEFANGANAGNSEFANAAMLAVFGEGWKDSDTMKLKYDKWGSGAAVSQEVVNYFSDSSQWDPALEDVFNGSANISFTDNIPELFDLLENTAVEIAGKRESLGSGANMITNAATITNSITPPSTHTGTSAEYFSQLWASSAWDSSYLMGGDGSDYNANAGQLTDNQLTNAIANAGVIKARNVALGTYLKDLGYTDVGDTISNYTYTNSVVPNDAAACFVGGGNLEDLGLNFSSTEEEDAVYFAILDYYNMSESDSGLVQGDITASQAYTDGLAYYAMMSTVDSLKDSTNLDKTNDETWWNDLSSAVDMYSSIANGSANLEDLNTMYSGMGNVPANSVVAMLVVQDGVPTVKISPKMGN